MNPIIKNILAIILGGIVGSLVNMGLVNLGNLLLPINGVDPNDLDELAKVMPTLSYEYFLFPFLAHALGTLTGALVAGLIAANRKMTYAIGIGILFLIGGIAVNFILPGPAGFAFIDIIFAYIPMAWLGGRIAEKLSIKNNNSKTINV